MSLIEALLDKPASLSTASRYTVMNGFIYLGCGALLIAWPGVTQTIFMDRAFVGDEAALIRVMGMTVAVIGWLYLFGGRSGDDKSSPLPWSTDWCWSPRCSCPWRSPACSLIC